MQLRFRSIYLGSQDIYFLLAIALMVAALILKIPIPYLGRVGLGNLILPVLRFWPALFYHRN